MFLEFSDYPRSSRQYIEILREISVALNRILDDSRPRDGGTLRTGGRPRSTTLKVDSWELDPPLLRHPTPYMWGFSGGCG